MSSNEQPIETVDGIPVPKFQHHPDCSTARLAWVIGSQGDRLWKCRQCGRFKVQTIPTDMPAASAHQGSPFRCREHHEEHVDAKGRGCPRCTRRPRRARKASPAPLAYTTPSIDNWTETP